ncbi:MAG: DNA repair protein RadC [Chloroflexi bacterium]|nr:DNA repair protein RadC [Chloroflexota bacterium]MBU1750874.1 DNA repair protein RadC [Chloroflexota bacterium]
MSEEPPQRPEYHLTIKALPAGERPRERLAELGPAALSDAELLGLVMRTGTQRGETAVDLGRRLLLRFGGLAGLARANVSELCAEHGIGIAKAAEIKAVIELARRLMVVGPEERPVIRSPGDIANLLMLEMSLLDQEQIRVVLLNTKNMVLGVRLVYQGSLNTSVVRTGELFREAIRESCAAVVVVHNHPSGDPSPSPEDVAVTRDLVKAGEILGIDVLDHVVIGEGRYVSMKERGLGFG